MNHLKIQEDELLTDFFLLFAPYILFLFKASEWGGGAAEPLARSPKAYGTEYYWNGAILNLNI